jgi:amidohydrolase family protein
MVVHVRRSLWRLSFSAALALLISCSSSTSVVPAPTIAPLISAPPAGAALPLFDAHIHYSEPAWSLLTPDEALARLARSGIRRAIVSSSPDTGTQRLYDRAPDVVVPFLRPYRSDVGPATWARDGTTVAYMQATYRRGVHRGIGEIHLSPGEVELPVVRAVLDLAVNERIWLLVHTDARGIDEVMAYVRGRTRVLWAHAGQLATPDEIRRLIERHPTMWVELAGRSDMSAGGAIEPAWRSLFIAHADRFLVGSDTWINPQWERLEDIHAFTQSWLTLLPADVARRIASGNADELFPPAPN